MIGSISRPVPVFNIGSDPPEMVTSEFFTYRSGYIVSDTIIPGMGYWVKVDQPGSLLLSASQINSLFKCIKIAPDDERPPLAPFDLLSSDDKTIPGMFVLYQNYPNPFNPSTTIRFDIPAQTHVRLEVYNILGSLVRTLLDEVKNTGSYSITWDGLDTNGNQSPTGLYYYRLRSGNFYQVQKALFMK
jgi:hypothetical protein